MGIDKVILAECVQSLSMADSRAKRGDVLRYYSRLCGVSVGNLRRRCKAAGVDFGYARRKDAGTPKRDELAAAAEQVVTLIVKSQGDMPTWVAIDKARKHGLIDSTLDLSVAYVDRYIRDRGIERRPAKTPATVRRCRWGQVGDTLQIDSTNCQQWFFVNDDGSIRYTQTGEVYRNKPAKCPPIIRYVGVDPTSGNFRVRYYQAAGESADVTLEFLYWIMSRSPMPDRQPMAGVPQVLVMDKGPGNTSSAVKNLCNQLGIEPRYHATGHSWAKGSVEKLMFLWQQSFESELRLWPARSLDELNERAELANAEFCLTRTHSRTQQPRSVFYAENVPANGIVLPPPWEMFVEAATSSAQQRTVDGYGLISLDGDSYYVGALEGVKRGDKVTVARAVLDWNEDSRPVRITHGDQTVIEKRLTRDEQGNYLDRRLYVQRDDAALEASAEQHAARMAAPVPAEPARPDLAKAPTVKVPAARLVVAPSQPQAVKRRSAALLELADRLGRELELFEVHALRWGDTVPQSQIEAAVVSLSPEPISEKESGGQSAATA